MNKIRFSLLLAIGIVSQVAMAQTVEQGKTFMYYERYKSAQETFEKILAANPNNIDAVYWLGQAMIHQKDTTGAKALYQKMLATNGSAPLLLVGMGEIELMQGNNNDARQRFETAISLTKGKDINVINAIGLANVETKAGDANYAIEKLTAATQIKNFNNADTWLTIGDAYRKLLDGGNAVTAYIKALGINPKLAAAKFKIGIIYYTQNNKDYFLPAFEDATKLDPAFAPAYYELYLYWYLHDVNKAATYLDKYTANADPGPILEYMKVFYLYGSAKFADARTKAQALISQYGDKVDPVMYRQVAYTSDTLGDLSAAKNAITSFLVKADTAAILGADYEELAKIDSKMPDTPTKIEAFKYYKMAIARDTLQDNKTKYVKEASDLAKALGNKAISAELAGVLYSTIKEPNNTDLYNLGIANYQAGNYKTSDSIFCGIYTVKYPDQMYGYLWCARSKHAEDDSANSGGLAVDPYLKLADVLKKLDSVKYKAQITEAYFYLAGYYHDIKKDKPLAIEYVQKILDVDPGNANATQIMEILKRPPPKQPAQKPKTTVKTGTN
jgi:tetratricopeptide (TPR) repeat protein